MMDRVYARDYLTQHLVDGEPLTREDVDDIVAAGVAKLSEFEERLPNRWWHESHEPFPEGWSDEDDKAVNG